MNLRQYLFLFTLGTGIAFASWILVIIYVDPLATGMPGVFVFYITLACALIGFFTTLGTLIRALRKKEEGIETHITRSLRQAIFFTLLIIAALFLQSRSWLNLITIIILVAIFGVVESLSLAMQTSKK